MSHAFEAELSTQYTDIRQRLRDGNGHAKIDHPIDLRPGAKKPPSLVFLLDEIGLLKGRLDTVEHKLESLASGHDGHQPGILNQIKRLVCEYEEVSLIDIESARRPGHVILARQLGYFLSRKFTRKTMAQIGAAYGSRDHTTIIHGCEVMRKLVANSAKLKAKIEWYGERIKLFDKPA